MIHFWLRLINSSELRHSRIVGRRVGLMVLIFFAIAIGVLLPDRRTGVFGIPVALLFAFLFLIAVIAFGAPVLVIELSRRERRARLARRYPTFKSFPVLLIPATRSFLAALGGPPISNLLDSVEVMVTADSLDFWLGSNRPGMVRSVPHQDFKVARCGSVDSYQCIEVLVKGSDEPVPLLLAGPFLAINQAGVGWAVALINEAVANGLTW